MLRPNMLHPNTSFSAPINELKSTVLLVFTLLDLNHYEKYANAIYQSATCAPIKVSHLFVLSFRLSNGMLIERCETLSGTKISVFVYSEVRLTFLLQG